MFRGMDERGSRPQRAWCSVRERHAVCAKFCVETRESADTVVDTPFTKVGHTVLASFCWSSYRFVQQGVNLAPGINRCVLWSELHSGMRYRACCLCIFSCLHFMFAVFNASIGPIGSSSSNSKCVRRG